MKIIVLSDMDQKGSGYSNITAPLITGLVNRGYDQIKVVGLGYDGSEHNYPFSILPAKNFQEVFAMLQNLYGMMQFDILVVALDIPLQEQILFQLENRPFKYVGIMPVEADPLCVTWAMALMRMDKVFIISEFGTQEAKKVGIQAEHIQVGIDTDFWRKPGLDEYKKIRQSLFGIEDNTFVVLTVADNQERKNLSRSMEIFAGFSKEIPNSKYVLVTREHQMVGWRLRDYAQELGIGEKLMIFERGMPLKDLWATYAGSDAFLLTSKAEGLNMCILEAMAVGLPVVATKCTALEELVSGRGWMIPHEHENDPENVYRDPFGNGRRYFADKQKGIQLLLDAYYYSLSSTDTMDIACRYAERRDWNVAIDQLDKALKELGPVGG